MSKTHHIQIKLYIFTSELIPSYVLKPVDSNENNTI